MNLEIFANMLHAVSFSISKLITITAITKSAVLAFQHWLCQKSISATMALLLEGCDAYLGAALINNLFKGSVLSSKYGD